MVVPAVAGLGKIGTALDYPRNLWRDQREAPLDGPVESVPLPEILTPVAAELELVRDLIRAAVATEELTEGLVPWLSLPLAAMESLPHNSERFEVSWLHQMCAYLLGAQGKYLRSGLVIGIAKAFGYQAEHRLRLAAAVELIHTATLVHDDVLDEAQLRRGQPTMRSVWGNKAAVLLGDYLFSKAFSLLAECESTQLAHVFTRATAALCHGEISQLQWIDDHTMSRDQYFDLIAKKTAELMSACTEGAARLMQLSTGVVEAWRAYGYHLGMAFQLTDDLLDFRATEKAWGKEIGHDASNGKYTMPMIVLLESLPNARAFTQRLQKKQIPWEELVSAIEQAGGFQQASLQAHKFAQLARDALLTAGQGATYPQSLQMLDELVGFVLARGH